MAKPQVPTPKTPKLFDELIIPFNQSLSDQLDWLNIAFGQTEKVFDKDNNYKPVCYAGKLLKGEYSNVFPDEFFGTNAGIKGYCFWIVGDVDAKLLSTNDMGTFKSKCSLVFWFNVDKVLDDKEEFRNIDKIIHEIINSFVKANWAVNGQALLTGYTRDVNKIFDMFPTKNVKNRFFTPPFFGVKFYLDVTIQNKC